MRNWLFAAFLLTLFSVSGFAFQNQDKLTINGINATNFTETYDGYIVEMEKPPVVAKERELRDTAERNKKQLASAGLLRGIYEIFSLTPEKVPGEMAVYKKQLRDERNRLRAQIESTGAGARARSSSRSGSIVGEYENTFNGFAIDADDVQADQMRKIPGVKKVYPNLKVSATLYNSVKIINADDMWSIDVYGGNCTTSGMPCLTGRGITIAIIDTGVDYTHSDLGSGLGNKVIGGYDFVNNDNDPMDDNGHGTHVAATAAGNGILKGVAPDAKILAYKALDQNGAGSFSWIISSIEKSVDPNGDGNFSDRANVISMSLGVNCGLYSVYCGPDDPVSAAVDNAVLAGSVVTVAAGNSGPYPETIGSPGTSKRAITVGASGNLGGNYVAKFSSRGPVKYNENVLAKPDIVAPGDTICAAKSSQDKISTSYSYIGTDVHCIDGKHIAIPGTSMATPHVAGAAALILQAYPSSTPEKIKALLMTSAKKLDDANYWEQGSGKIDVLEAYNAYFNSPASLDFLDFGVITANSGTVSRSLQFTISNYGPPRTYYISAQPTPDGASISLSKTSFSADWNSENNITVNLNADASALKEGDYVTTITIDQGFYSYRIPVTFSKWSKLKMMFPDYIPIAAFIFNSTGFIRVTTTGNTTVFLPRGQYTVQAFYLPIAYPFHPNVMYISKDKINVLGESTVYISTKDAKNTLSVNIVSENSSAIVSESRLSVTRWLNGLDLSGILPFDPPYKVSDIDDGSRVAVASVGEFNNDKIKADEVYFVLNSFDGIYSNRDVGSDPNKYKHISYKFQNPQGTPLYLFHNFAWPESRNSFNYHFFPAETIMSKNFSVRGHYDIMQGPVNSDFYTRIFLSTDSEMKNVIARTPALRIVNGTVKMYSNAFPNSPYNNYYDEINIPSNGVYSGNDGGISYEINLSRPMSVSTFVSASSSTASSGTNITLTFASPSPTVRDWIGLYQIGAADTAYKGWIFTSSCTTTAGATAKTSGACSFPIKPDMPAGTYEFRLFSNNDYILLAKSSQVVVTATVSTAVLKTYSSAVRGTSTDVTFSNIPSPTITDWIGLYSVGSADGTHKDWVYTNSCTKNAGTSAASFGSCNFMIPANLPAGQYEFRMFKENGYTRITTSGIFNVTLPANLNSVQPSSSSVLAGNSIAVSFNASNPTVNDWFGLYQIGAADTAYKAWVYTSSCSNIAGTDAKSSGACQFPVRQDVLAGTYEFRLFANNGYTLLAKSAPITVTTSAPVAASISAPSSASPGASVDITFSNIANPTTTDWFGLYAAGAADTAHNGWLYTSSCTNAVGTAAKTSGTCSFAIRSGLSSGQYEFRMFKENGYSRITTSGVMNIASPVIAVEKTIFENIVPSGLSPSGRIYGTQQILSWGKIDGASMYNIIISNTGDEEPFYDTNVQTNSTSLQLNPGYYTWKIQGINDRLERTKWSTETQFIVSSYPPIDIVGPSFTGRSTSNDVLEEFWQRVYRLFGF